MTKLVIGIAGGSGSGKTTLADALRDAFPQKTAVLHQDDYFIAKKDMPLFAGERNVDDPKSTDHAKLVQDIKKLVDDEHGPDLIIVEGFLLLHYEDVRELLGLKIFLNAPFEVIADRRVQPIWDNYRQHVLKPMYEKYVLPSTRYADVTYNAASQDAATILKQTLELISKNRLKNANN